MSNHPSSFSEWQNYPLTLDPIHVAWLKSAKKSKTAFLGPVDFPNPMYLDVMVFTCRNAYID